VLRWPSVPPTRSRHALHRDVLVFLVQIAARFGFNRPLPWTDELRWCSMSGSSCGPQRFMVPTREHVVFDLVWNVASRRIRA